MGRTLELGRRIELQAMDRLCHNISLALYRRENGDRSVYLVHTYSDHPNAAARVSEITRGLVGSAGMERLPELADGFEWLSFACGGRHERALRRTFLEVCKQTGDAIGGVLPLVRVDKKAGCELTVISESAGRYRITSPAGHELAPRRCRAVARGFAKLCEMELEESDPSVIRFDCGVEHDVLMGSLFFRAQNVRSAMQEDELAASRGTLAAPGSQDGA